MNGVQRKSIGGYESAEASNAKARILETPGLSKRVIFYKEVAVYLLRFVNILF